MNSTEHIAKAEFLLAWLEEYNGRVGMGLAQTTALRAQAHISLAYYRKDEENARSRYEAMRRMPPG